METSDLAIAAGNIHVRLIEPLMRRGDNFNGSDFREAEEPLRKSTAGRTNLCLPGLATSGRRLPYERNYRGSSGLRLSHAQSLLTKYAAQQYVLPHLRYDDVVAPQTLEQRQNQVGRKARPIS